jgi:tetratricopeptide (TPR) repeat protein
MSYEIPPEAHRLHAEGRSAGSRGDYDNALTLLGRAAALAPERPYPPYDAAFTHLMRGDTRAAQNLYERVALLSPGGFFTCRTTLDMLRREHAGQLSRGFSRAFVQLEWMEDREQKKRILRGITQQFPGFPPAWEKLSLLLDDPQDRLIALDNGLAGDPDPDTKTTLLLNKAGLFASMGNLVAAATLYSMIADDPDVTPTGAAFARAFRNTRLPGL